jgi:bacteriocin biosynthesis cyclodehydratase domain-containing protein
MSRLPARPFLAPGFTILPGPDRVRLVAGEDFRYTLTGPGLESWLPAWLPALDGGRTAEDLLGLLPPERRDPARQLLAHLYGERVVLDGPAAAAHAPARHTLRPEGTGLLAERLKAPTLAPQACSEGRVVSVLAQDRLDYDEARRFNRRCLDGGVPWLWVTCGPLTRGYVSPVFLPDAGPCLACLLGHFQRLSPAPEIYADLEEHARQGQPLAPAPFPERGLRILAELAMWKVELLEHPQAPAALFRLHVLEEATLEVTAHRVFADPECGECRGRR